MAIHTSGGGNTRFVGAINPEEVVQCNCNVEEVGIVDVGHGIERLDGRVSQHGDVGHPSPQLRHVVRTVAVSCGKVEVVDSTLFDRNIVW